MSRHSKMISLDDFKKIVKEKLFTEDSEGEIKFPYDLPSKIEADLKKVMFDFENYYVGDADPNYDKKYDDEHTDGGRYGYKLLRNKMPVLVCGAGGDWEYPVAFIIYYSSAKELRAYIPEEGNTYDKKYKTAYGSQAETSLWEKEYGHISILDQPPADDGEDRSMDWIAMEDDIISRIKIKA